MFKLKNLPKRYELFCFLIDSEPKTQLYDLIPVLEAKFERNLPQTRVNIERVVSNKIDNKDEKIILGFRRFDTFSIGPNLKTPGNFDEDTQYFENANELIEHLFSLFLFYKEIPSS